MLHVVRQFQDPAVPRMRGSVDAARDAADMEAELALSDLGILERRLERIEALQKGKGYPVKDGDMIIFLFNR